MWQGKNGQHKQGRTLILAGFAIVALLFAGVGSMAAYGILFPPVWTEPLPFLNSTGQHSIVTIYRNATDATYGNVTAFVAEAAPALEEAIAADPRYRCVEYAVTLHDAAQRCGINCSIVGAGAIDGAAAGGQGSGAWDGRGTPRQALVAFRTTDGGMAYVDPTAMNVSAADYPGVDFSRIVLLREAWNDTTDAANAVGLSPDLTEQRSAAPISYGRMAAFLAADGTEDRPYDYPNYTCLDFAVALHNRAEAARIKCAVVTVGFVNQSQGHAFNAFPTTDRGIVYVDCTGISETNEARGAEPSDNVVYLREGGGLGELPIEQTDGNLDYGFYLDRKERIDAYRRQWNLYAADVAAHNAEVAERAAQVAANDRYYAAYSDECDQYGAALDAYNRQMNLHNAGLAAAPTDLAELEAWKARLDAEYDLYSATWSRLETWRQELNQHKAALDGRLSALRNAEESKWITYSPMGVVENVEVFWG